MNFIFKLFGWFFSNLLLIVIVVAGCYAFVYWDDPFGKETPVGKVMAAFPDETETVKGFIAKLKIDDTSLFTDEEVSEDSTVIVSSETSESAEAVTADAMSSDQAVSSLNSDGVVSADSGLAVEPAPEMRIDQSVDGSGFVTPEIEQALNQIKADGSVTAAATAQAASQAANETAGGGAGESAGSDPATANLPRAAARQWPARAAPAPLDRSRSVELSPEEAAAREMMIDARRAFMKRDYEASIAAYEKLVSEQKDNFDALGELGNVYYNQGDEQKAADAYYQAATIMIAQGQARRAASLVGFLRSVDEDKAEQLQKSIDASRETPESL